ASATTPTSKIWQRRSLAHSLRTIDSIEKPLLSRFTPPIHQRDQENKNDSFSRCNPKRGWRADGVSQQLLYKWGLAGGASTQKRGVPAQAQRPGQQCAGI